MGLRRCLEISKSYLCMCVSQGISREKGSVALWEWETEQDEIIGKKRVNKAGVFSPGLHTSMQVHMCAACSEASSLY